MLFLKLFVLFSLLYNFTTALPIPTTICYENDCLCTVDQTTLICEENHSEHPLIGRSRQKLLTKMIITAKQQPLFDDICEYENLAKVIFDGPCPQLPFNCSTEKEIVW